MHSDISSHSLIKIHLALIGKKGVFALCVRVCYPSVLEYKVPVFGVVVMTFRDIHCNNFYRMKHR